MKLFLRAGLLAFTMAAVAGCGGGGGSDGGPSLTPGEGADNGSNDADSNLVRFGLPSDSGFNDGVMQASPEQLANGESATLFAAFVDENGLPDDTTAEISFTSTCIASGLSSINPTTVTNSRGSIETTYTANGCNINDNVIATTQINGTTLSANVTIQTSSDTGSGGTDGGNNQNPDTDIRFGKFSGGQFNDGEIAANYTTLEPGDTVDLSVSFIDANGQPYTGAAEVTLTSTCISAGLSTINPATASNTNGLIQAEYSSTSCNGEDNIIATASVDNTTLRATVVLTTEFNNHFGSYVGGRFENGLLRTSSSTLKTGETASLTVQLLDAQENAIVGQNVRFSSGCVGSDLAAITSTAATNASGTATASYTADGCDGEDIVVAETRYEGQNLTATTTLTADALQVRLGSFEKVNFNEGRIASSTTNVITAGEATTLTVDFLDQNGDRYTGDADIFFSSGCLSSGLAELEPAIASNNGGTASVVYTARGCNGSDDITATTRVADNTLTATVTLTTDQPPLGTLQFISATPQIIGLKGTESINDIDNEDEREIGSQSTIVFKVTSTDGSPLPNQPVDFELVSGDSGAGNDGPDAFLNRYSGTSDSAGLVSTVVNPGTNAIPVRVRATTTHEGSDASALSNSLAITTGIPDQDSISLSASCLNPSHYDWNNGEIVITALLSDRFNNPVPDGTTVLFRTEGGAIEASCDTGIGDFNHGECSVALRSQAPRPDNGRVTVMAFAIGEESFQDTNPSNGRFDDGEVYTDIAEPFLDSNENGIRDTNESYVNFNSSSATGDHDGPNGFYDGLLCNKNGVNNECNPDSETLFVSDDIVIVFADSSNLIVELLDGPDRTTASPISSIDLNAGSTTIYVHVYDSRGQVPPAGTTVSVSSDVGNLIGNEGIVPSTNTSGQYYATFTAVPADNVTQTQNGAVEVTVVSDGNCSENGPPETTYYRAISIKQDP